MEAQGLVLNHAAVKLEARRLEALARTRVARVQNRHVVLRSHLVDGVEKRQKVLLRVNVLLAMRAQQNVLPLLQPQPRMNIRSLNLGQVVMQHFRHGRSGHIRALLRQPRICQIAARMLAIRHVHVGNDIHDAPVRLFRQALVYTAMAGISRDTHSLLSTMVTWA